MITKYQTPDGKQFFDCPKKVKDSSGRWHTGVSASNWLTIPGCTIASLDDPPAPVDPPKIYSKLSILDAISQLGYEEEFIALIEADDAVNRRWLISSYISEDHPMVVDLLPALAESLGVSDETIATILESCKIEQ